VNGADPELAFDRLRIVVLYRDLWHYLHASCALESVGVACGGCDLTDDREEFIRRLIARYNAGELGKDHLLQGIAEFDALAATKRMQVYSLLSTIAAAIAALASAATAYFAYFGIHR
jgi:hypothetical protein